MLTANHLEALRDRIPADKAEKIKADYDAVDVAIIAANALVRENYAACNRAVQGT